MADVCEPSAAGDSSIALRLHRDDGSTPLGTTNYWVAPAASDGSISPIEWTAPHRVLSVVIGVNFTIFEGDVMNLLISKNGSTTLVAAGISSTEKLCYSFRFSADAGDALGVLVVSTGQTNVVGTVDFLRRWHR